MKKKRIASKLLSLLLSAAVIVSSSFSGITLVDVSATQATEQEAVAVSQNAVADVTEDEETVSANAVAEEPAQEAVAQPAQEPQAAAPAVEDDVQDKASVTSPQPYISAEDYASMDRGTQEEEKVTSFSLESGDGNFGIASFETAEPGAEETLGEVEETQESVVSERASVTPSDSKLVTQLVGETALANALLKIYNADYNDGTDIAISAFKFSHLKKMDNVVDLSSVSNASSISLATGVGYLVNAKEINLTGTNITFIPKEEFWKNSSLVTITLPDTVTGFGESAFYGCTALENINSSVAKNTLPSYLDDAKMGSGVFQGCTALEKITIPSMKNDTYALRPATSMFSGCTALQSVTIGAGVATIPNSCFFSAGDSTSGMTVTIESGSLLDAVLDSAFQNCNISELDLSMCTKLATIGVRCFTPRKSTATKKEDTECAIPLTKLLLPETVSASGLSIGDEAFFYAPLATVGVGNSFATGVVNLPNYIKEIGMAAFYGNSAMTTLHLPANLSVINKFTFAECTELTSVTAETTSVTVGIANQAFHNAAKLSSADFLANMKKLSYIGEEAYVLGESDDDVEIIGYFSYKTDGYSSKKLYASAVFVGTAITSATFPESLRTIGAYAFGTITTLEEVTWNTDQALAAGAKYEIGTDAFTACSNLTTFIYPTTGTKKVSFVIEGRAFANCSSLTNFATSADIADASKNALPYALTKVGLVAFAGCTALEYMKMTNNVNGACPEIQPGVFSICNSLHTVELPTTIEEIPEDMFYDCALTKFPVPEGSSSLKSIGYAAFFGNRMQEVDLSAHTELHTIGTIAFAYHDPYEEATDSDGNKVTIVADEILMTVTNEETGKETTVAETSLAPLTTLILPDAVTGTYYNMVWGDNMLQAAGNFTTVKTKSKGENGKVFVPNYVVQSEVGDCVFAATAVTEATWEYATLTSGAYRWTGIPDGMFALTPVDDIADCCIPAADVKTLGTLSYAGTQITTVDLTKYPSLEETGDGTFALCGKLTSIKLPTNGLYTNVSDHLCYVGNFKNDIGLQVVDQDVAEDAFSSGLAQIDFGTVKTIGKYAFASMDEAINNKDELISIDYSDKLTKLDFSSTKVETIGQGAFEGTTSLQTVNFAGVKQIGDGAFLYCTNVNLAYDPEDATAVNPFADSIETIGNYAFASCWNIGGIVFGTNLKSIGNYAFNACAAVNSDEEKMLEGYGLVSVDFSKATKLAEIGTYAFASTPIVNFDISNSAVTQLKEGAVSDCPLLETIVLGEKMQRVLKNAAYGCVNLGSVDFYSTTTIDLQAFYQAGKFKGVNTDGQVVYITPIDQVNFRLTPVELNVGLGNSMMFPYYVNDTKNGSGEFGEIVIGEANVGNEDPTIHQYVKVQANTSKYYKNNTDPSNIVTDSNYFEKVDAIEYSVNNTTVYTFKIAGLKATPANTTIPFSVTSGYTFTAAGNVSAEKTLTAKYNMKVMDISYYPTFYTDKARLYQYDELKVNTATGITTGTSTIRACEADPTGKVTLYYDITPIYKTNWRPETGNLVVTTSNPDVISFGTGSGMKKVNDTTYKMTAESSSSKEVQLSSLTSGKKLVVVPKKQGNAVVTIYHEDCPTKKVTWNITVKSDIKTVDLSVPSAYKTGVYEGDSFQVMNKITFYLGGSVTRSAGNLDTYKQYTDNIITFYVNNTSLATLDANGIMTIKKSSKTAQTLVFGCVVTRPDGTKTTSESSIDIKYPAFTTGKLARTSSGEQVKITKKTSGNKLAEVTYVAPLDGATSVTIPATVVVGGVTCKVTGIAEGAFKDNKKLKSVTIGKNVTVIPKNAFNGCTKLTKVTFKGKVTEIGESAFEKCTSLKKITIPKTVKKIGKRAFYNCKKLKTVTFKTKSKLQSIGESAFYGCKVMKKITIPSTYLKSIGAKAFQKCSKLQKITIKSKVVTSVGKNAFKGIYKKAVIDVPNSKLSAYKTLFKKGQGKKVKIK